MRAGRRAGAAVGVGASITLAAAVTNASCPLEVLAPPPSSWEPEVAALRRRLAAAEGDCASVSLAVEGQEGTITFTTTDGRVARRIVRGSQELQPTVEALLVNPPPPLPAAAAPGPAPERAAPPTPPTDDRRPSEVHFHVAAIGGVRLGLPGAYGAPTVGLRPSGTFGGWELGAAVEYDPTHVYLPGGLPSGVTLWSFAAGVQLGRRESLGAFGLGYGAGVGVAAIREEAPDASGAAKVADFGQPRVSAYGRVVVPRESRWRGTLDLGVDGGLGSVKRRATEAANLPDLPRWGLGLGLGVEASLL